MAEKRFYWLKLQRDFFKRHDIRIIEEMENGKDYLLFYLKLLVESIDHEGRLRFSDTIPYNEKMLSVVTNTNVDIVRAALNVFRELNLIEVLEDETLYMNEVQKMIGAASQDEHARESTRLRVQAYRDRKKQAEIVDERYCNATCNGEKELEIEKEIEKDKESTPAKHTYGEYRHVRLKDEEYQKLVSEYGQGMADACITFLDEYIEMKGYKAKSHYLCIRKWVVDAVKERQTKKPSGMLDQSYEMISRWAEGD